MLQVAVTTQPQDLEALRTALHAVIGHGEAVQQRPEVAEAMKNAKGLVQVSRCL